MRPCKCTDLYGSVKDWGCLWFQLWDTNTQVALNYEIELVVVYKRGLRGTLAGLGNSQRGEVQHIKDVLDVKPKEVDIDELLTMLS